MRLGEFLGDRPGKNWDFLHEESPRLGRVSGGGRGRNFGTFTPKDHPERAWIGAASEGKMRTKKGPAAICYEPFSGSLFVRFYDRLISDVIIVSPKKSLCLYYTVLSPVRQGVI